MAGTNIVAFNKKDRANVGGFTKDQANAYESLIEFINKPYNENDYKRALVGPAGTGKTFLLKAIIKNCGLSYSTIGLAAPTHKACRVIQESVNIPNVNINTLQSDLGLRLNFDVENFNIDNPPFDPKGRIKIGQYQLYIIDESSMINRGLCMFVEKICKQNKCKIIFVGDGSQLPPVNEKYSSAFKGIKIHSLTQVVRQGDDNPVSYLLDLLRYDIEHKTYTFLEYISKHPYNFNEDNTKGYSVCNTELFNLQVITHFSDEELTKNVDFCKVIAYTNNCVSSWNKFIRNNVIADSEKSVLTKNDLIISYTTIVDQYNDCVIKNSEEYIIKDIVNYTHPKYQLKGFMVKFQAIHGGKVTSPLFILDHSDMFTMQMYCKISQELIQAAKTARINLRPTKWKEYFQFKEGCLLITNILNPKDGKILFGRNIDYGFSLTAHKS